MSLPSGGLPGPSRRYLCEDQNTLQKKLFPKTNHQQRVDSIQSKNNFKELKIVDFGNFLNAFFGLWDIQTALKRLRELGNIGRIKS